MPAEVTGGETINSGHKKRRCGLLGLELLLPLALLLIARRRS
jgi:hypothetical protein